MGVMQGHRTRIVFAGAATALLAACGEPTATSASTFTADVTGSTNGRITGTATASFGDWTRQSALQVTLPDGQTFSGLALAGTDGTTISLFRSGTDLPAGTFAIGAIGGSSVVPPGAFSGGYAVRGTDGLQLFLADSGTVSITETGNRVSGTFTLYAKHYDVIPLPTPASSGQPITPLSSGESPVTINGSFDAARR